MVSKYFDALPALYIADGHHRSAAASRVAAARRSANSHHTGEESYNYFLSVIFPARQMRILDYNRVVRDLNGHSVESVLKAVGERCTVTPVGGTSQILIVLFSLADIACARS